MAYLVLVRHGQSEWNALGQWSGWANPALSAQGKQEAREAAEHLRDLTLHKGYTSDQTRAKQTLDEIKAALHHVELPITESAALKERDYGDYTGKNKWEVKAQVGDEEFTKIRRHWDHPVPNGETLKDVHARVVPYYQQNVLEDLKAGRNVIVAAHGNSLRALIKHLDDHPEDRAHELEIGTGEVHVYEVSENGKVIGKEIRNKGGKA
jgi:2,3-bisphosphoglycerate-dependent phosphoglycerate mutase